MKSKQKTGELCKHSPYWHLPIKQKNLLLAAALAAPLVISGCQSDSAQEAQAEETLQNAEGIATGAPQLMAMAAFETPLMELNHGKCEDKVYKQEYLKEPVKISPVKTKEGTEIHTQMVVRIKERCVPVWVPDPNNSKKGNWEYQTLNLRTYGFPRNPKVPIREKDADDPNSKRIAWSAPGPTIIMHPASAPGVNDGTEFNMHLYNRMPWAGDPHACNVIEKCNTKGPNAGHDENGQCKQPVTTNDGGWPASTPSQTIDGRIIEPPNCFHGDNSTNFHFHGFHVSPQANENANGEVVSFQDNVFVEIMPPMPAGDHAGHTDHSSMHGEIGSVEYGHAMYDVDPLRYTQPPGTHWYHAHKHGSTALQVLNGLVGSFEVRGEFDEQLQSFYDNKLKDRLLVVQQLQEQVPGMAGADQVGSMLVNGQANPIVTMRPGEIQRWRFIGATMQASALLNIGFPDTNDRAAPQVKQIAMDGVQFSRDNYECQPFLNNPDCSKEKDNTRFVEATDFNLAPGNRADMLVKAPLEPGKHCLVLGTTTKLQAELDALIKSRNNAQIQLTAQDCDLKYKDGEQPFGMLLTLVVEGTKKDMAFPTKAQFPKAPAYLNNIPDTVTLPGASTPTPIPTDDLFYQMYNQFDLPGVQFWISQTKFNPECFDETLTMDVPEEWTIYNNSGGVKHPFHIHQNPFQLMEESGRGKYKYPVWRDTLALPTAPGGNTLAPNSDPKDWGHAKIRYVAKEFTGPFVNHCHILGHEDRGMMHATQAVCDNGDWARTGQVVNPATCDAEGFCESDCQRNGGNPDYFPAAPQCPAPPPQQSDWPKAYGAKLN